MDLKMTQSWERTVYISGDRLKVHRDLDRLEHWAVSNKMLFNSKKCRILHLESGKMIYRYKIANTWLGNSRKHLGVLADYTVSMNQEVMSSTFGLQKKYILTIRTSHLSMCFSTKVDHLGTKVNHNDQEHAGAV